MQLWAGEGPWAGRRLSAANHASGNGGSPHPAGWGRAAKSREFVLPSALRRSISRGAPALIPTVAGAKKLRETHEEAKNATAAPKGTQSIIAGESPLHLVARIPQAEARVRRDTHARETIPSSSKGAPNSIALCGAAQLHQWIAKARGREEPPQEQHRGRRPISTSSSSR